MKQGDLVKIIDCFCWHSFEIGDICEVVAVFFDHLEVMRITDGSIYAVAHDEIEEYKPIKNCVINLNDKSEPRKGYTGKIMTCDEDLPNYDQKFCTHKNKYKNILTHTLRIWSCPDCGADLGEIKE